MKKFKKIISTLLASCIVASCAATGSLAASAAPVDGDHPELAQDTVQGGAILHCFDWSYNAIKANLADIKAAGYTAVQTSPVQPPKDYSASYTESSSNWWKLYQPLDLCVAESGSWLGTKGELTEMCAEAETYGIKVIVDIVSNHLASNGSVGTGKFTNYLHADVNSERAEFVDAVEPLFRTRAKDVRRFRPDRGILRHKLFNEKIKRRAPDPARDEREPFRSRRASGGVPAVSERAPQFERVAGPERRHSRRRLADDGVDRLHAPGRRIGVVDRERTPENRIVRVREPQHEELAGPGERRELRRLERDATDRGGDLRVGQNLARSAKEFVV